MKPTLKFNIKGLTVSGEWDEVSRLALITDLDGDLGIEGRFMGFAVNVRGSVDAAMDNYVRVKINAIGQLPNFLIPGILNLMKIFSTRFAKAASVERDMILINPNQLIPDSSDIKVLIQPKTFEISNEAVGSLRERILAWTEKKAGSAAKETVDIILTIPDLLMLLINLAKDPRIPTGLKLKITLCIAYVVSPIDIIPEILSGPLGFVDDAAAIWLLIAGLVTEIPTEIIRENWQGRPDVLEMIIQGHALTGFASKLPDEVFKKLVSLFGSTRSEAAATVVS